MYLLYIQKTETVSSVFPGKENATVYFMGNGFSKWVQKPGSAKTSVSNAAAKMVYSFSYF